MSLLSEILTITPNKLSPPFWSQRVYRVSGLVMLIALLLDLIAINICYCHHFVMAPLDHKYCLSRSQSDVMNKLSVGHRMLTIKIDPQINVANITKINSLCPATLVKPFGKLVRRDVDARSSWSYWHLSLKIVGQFSSCADYMLISEMDDEYSDSILKRARASALRLHCRSQFPAVLQVRRRQILIWWHWSQKTQPKFVLQILPYIRYHGHWTIPQKKKVCDQLTGFWCGDACIHGGMRCDGSNDCDAFSLKEKSTLPSADELHCEVNRNVSVISVASELPYYESKWIGNSLYILLGVTTLILLVSGLKIWLHNTTLASKLRKSQSVASIQSSSSSSSYDKPDDEEVYEELPMFIESQSNKSPSLNISLDDVTHEELLVSNECLDCNFGDEIVQPRPLDERESHNLVVNTSQTICPQLHSLPSSQCQSNASSQAPLLPAPTRSVTGSILAHGQDVIARLNVNGSSRILRNKLWKTFRTSSYDKINEAGATSAQMSHVANGQPQNYGNGKPKSHTISRLEMNTHSGAAKDEYGTSYVII